MVGTIAKSPIILEILVGVEDLVSVQYRCLTKWIACMHGWGLYTPENKTITQWKMVMCFMHF